MTSLPWELKLHPHHIETLLSSIRREGSQQLHALASNVRTVFSSIPCQSNTATRGGKNRLECERRAEAGVDKANKFDFDTTPLLKKFEVLRTANSGACATNFSGSEECAPQLCKEYLKLWRIVGFAEFFLPQPDSVPTNEVIKDIHFLQHLSQAAHIATQNEPKTAAVERPKQIRHRPPERAPRHREDAA